MPVKEGKLSITNVIFKTVNDSLLKKSPGGL